MSTVTWTEQDYRALDEFAKHAANLAAFEALFADPMTPAGAAPAVAATPGLCHPEDGQVEGAASLTAHPSPQDARAQRIAENVAIFDALWGPDRDDHLPYALAADEAEPPDETAEERESFVQWCGRMALRAAVAVALCALVAWALTSCGRDPEPNPQMTYCVNHGGDYSFNGAAGSWKCTGVTP